MTCDEKVHKAKENFILDQCESNKTALLELNAQYIKFLKLEDTNLK